MSLKSCQKNLLQTNPMLNFGCTLMGKSLFLSLFQVVVLHFFIAGITVQVTNITTDQSALLAFKAYITHDPSSLLATWSTTTSVCNWTGVTCGSLHHRVTALDLSHMGLTGTISPHIGNLSFLSSLSLRNNSLHGSLPIELAKLRRLTFINFALNSFSVEIPSWFGSFTQLQSLFLFSNNFVGAIPSSLCNISTLEILDFYDNNLQGSIPEAIGNLQNLKILYLAGNQLSGSIPSTIFNISTVQNIDITDNQLTGSMPSTMLNISSLRIIDFSTNNLSGPLPSNLFDNLPNLEALYLTWNQFSGQIPSSLFKCKKLQSLSLSNNHFEGIVPAEIGNLTMLKMLYLGRNNFKGGEVPLQIGDMINLEILSLPYSSLTGPIPSGIGNLTQLKFLDLQYNNLTGEIPDEIGNLQNLETLILSVNRITGLIPSTIFNVSTIGIIALSKNHLSGHLPPSTGFWLPNLEWFVLGGNELSGLIPSSISNASQLTTIELSSNSFSGFIPSELGNLRNLQRLRLQNNYLTSNSPELSFISSLTNCKYLTSLEFSGNPLNSTLPISIGNLSTSVQRLSASDCKIKGSIPGQISSLSNLTFLSLENNELTGTVPTTIGRLQALQFLSLQDNKLQGFVPSELCQLEGLAYLFLAGNKLSGSIPACLDNLISLRTLSLGSNQFTSIIPSTLWSLKDILRVNLSSNSLNGSLPLDIGNLKVVTEIDLSRNQLSGDIPITVEGLKYLKHLSLADNRFQGPIPQSFGNLISLEFLDLSNNGLSGEIPKSLETLLYLESLNLSFNKLQGEIPTGGPIANFSFQSFMGNEELCGPPQMKVPLCNNIIPGGSKSASDLVLIYILPAVASILVLALIIIVLIRCQKRDVKLPTQEDFLPLATWRRISYHELQRATDGFSETNLLGTGSFGSVYKGTLPNGMNLAIKVFSLQLEGAFRSFDAESEVMRNIRHRNLVKIISSCCNIDFKALVLELMPNGSLEKRLYSSTYFLDILQRLNIMIDVAYALEYLHHDCKTPVVHCDLKPSNVLLDEDIVAHLSDFGIAKLLGEGDSMTQTMTLATIGYMTPEYGSEGIVSTRGDVYSYGILLMETFTKKKPTDEMFTGEMSLKRWVKELLPHAVTKVVDGSLLETEEEHFVAKKDCLSSIMGLGLECSSELPEERINIKDVLAMLKKIKVRFLKEVEQV